MLLGLRLLIIACLLVGIIVCTMGMKTKNILYRGGFYFLIFLFMEEIYSLIAPPYIQRLIDQGIDNPGLLVKNSTVPPLILTAVALIIYLIYLLRGLKNSNS
jgi:hypothetical protein